MRAGFFTVSRIAENVFPAQDAIYFFLLSAAHAPSSAARAVAVRYMERRGATQSRIHRSGALSLNNPPSFPLESLL